MLISAINIASINRGNFLYTAALFEFQSTTTKKLQARFSFFGGEEKKNKKRKKSVEKNLLY
jgi:hypothetical protein